MNFLNQCAEGLTDPKCIDGFVEMWELNGSTFTLQFALGMTDEEFEAWEHDPAYLSAILKFREIGEDFYASYNSCERCGEYEGPDGLEGREAGEFYHKYCPSCLNTH